MKNRIRYILCAILIQMIQLSVLGQNSVKLIDQNTGEAIPNATYVYGQQRGISDANGTIVISKTANKTLYLSHVSYGVFKLNKQQVDAAINSGQVLWVPDVSQLQSVTVIALRGNGLDSLLLSLDSRDRLSHDAGALLTQEPAVAVVRKSGSYGFDPVLRGFKYDRLNIVVDGVQSANAACPNRMDPPTSQVAINMTERIEVLKGPYALRYGSNIGGVINFVTSGARFVEQNDVYGRLSTSYETNGEVNRTEGRVGFNGKKYDVSLFGSWSQGDDYESGDSRLVPAGFKRGSFGTSMAFQLTNQQQLSINVVRNLARNVDFPTLPMDLTSDDTWLVNARHSITFNNRKLRTWETAVYGSFVDHLMDNYQKVLDPRKVNAETEAQTHNFGGRTEGKWNFDKGILYLGADVKMESAKGERSRTFLMGPQSGQTVYDNIWQDATINKGGLFAQYQLPWHSWQLMIAGRLEFNQSDAGKPVAGFEELYDGVSKLQVNPSLSIGFTRRLGTVFSIGIWGARTQRSAGITERYINYLPVGNDPYEMVGNPELSPEVNYQTDWTIAWQNKVSKVKFSYFASYLSNYISSEIREDWEPSMPSAPGVRQFVNLNEVVRTGFEASWQQQLFAGLQHHFQVAYVYAQSKANNEPLPEIAPMDIRYRLFGTYFKGRFKPEMGLRHVLKQDRVAESYGETETPAFTTFDLFALYRPYASLSLSAGVYNLFNANYYEHLSRSVRDESKGPLYAPGRSFVATLAWNF